MKRLLFILFIFITSIPIKSYAQKYEDYIGAGHNRDIKVYSSSSKYESTTGFTAKSVNTINGKGLDAEMMAASRLLAQASLGADLEIIKKVADTGIEPWIDEQMNIQGESYLQNIRDNLEITNQWELNHGVDSSDIDESANWSHFMYTWWEYNMFNDDLLRQRVALALSEILVLSFDSNLGGFGEAVASYYDIFSENAFGNYKDILTKVSYHPAMGYYLSHFNNPKTVEEDNIHPDENYAREVMQLFSIGLYELNNDGTRKTDANGDFIPTYTNDDIKEMAKVFTGLGPGAVVPNQWVDEPDFGYGIWVTDMTVPMKMYEDWHEQGEKHIVGGFTIPAGQTGDEDILMALDHLFNHPNVGPFVCKQLIQRLVKSNPTPAYVDRIASIFNDNGSGVRGDMKSVIKAILLDPEARECSWVNDETNGKLREPLLRYTQFARSVDKDNAYGHYWNIGYWFMENTGQMILSSPSVFNFFLPYFQPNGPIAEKGLIAPEFQIHNSKTSIGYLNSVFYWTRYEYLMSDWISEHPAVSTDFYNYELLTRNPEVFLNYLDIVYTYGMLSDRTRRIIRDNSKQLVNSSFKRNRAQLALYLLMVSPDYNIQK
jgi:uncharacterized protein (DUF1800 family)